MALGRLSLRGARVLLPLLAAATAGCAGEYPQTTFRPVTDFGALLNDLFADIFWWTMLVLAVVEILLIYVIWRYRHRPEAEAPRQIHGHTGLEVLWTVIPAVIVAFIAVPTVRTIFDTYRPAPENALVVEAIGHQWWWEFRLPQYEVATANQLHLPVGRPIEIRLRSADVLHNFWVPRLGGKRYNYPVSAGPADPEGAEHPNYNVLSFTIEEPGEYAGQCAEFCGLSHALMRMRVIADAPEDFDTWVRRMRTSVEPLPGTLEARGKEIFLRSACVACHAVQGTNARGVIGPNLTNYGARWAVGAGTAPNTPENVFAWIKDPQALKPGALMPGAEAGAGGLPPHGLDDEEIRAVTAYLLSLK